MAKGNLVQIRVAGGDLPDDIRIPATNQFFAFDYTATPVEIPTLEPYLVTFYVKLGSTIEATPPMQYFPGGRALLHDVRSGPRRNWYEAKRSLARVLDEAIAAARVGRFRSALPVGVTVTSWTLLASWAVPLACVVAIVARRSAVRNARRTPHAALA